MVYPFESGAFNQGIGEISKPIRSQYGYHLIKTTDRRPESGTVRVRQIFFAAGKELIRRKKLVLLEVSMKFTKDWKMARISWTCV